MIKLKIIFAVIAIFGCLSLGSAQVSAELIQYPDISEDNICFTYGDDLWIVPKSGGDAHRLISPLGRETTPKFSPDGMTLAYQANYDGNTDIYTLSIAGGVPSRVTGHGMNETLMGWTPDGQHLIYASSAESGKQRWAQFYKIPVTGGLPDKFPIELGAFADVSADGNKIAFTDKSRVSRNWKRYRGGTAPDITIMDLNTLESENITTNDANDEIPMWHGDKLYYLSDKGPALRHNIWVYDTNTKQHKQLTKYTDYDVHYPSMGPSDLVYEAAGKLYVMNLQNAKSTEVKINAVGDFTRIKSVEKKVEDEIDNFHISPDGNRALICARGEIFTLPKEKGFVKNETRSSEFAERFPAWSPDGRSLAYFSDRSGEYELTIKDLKTNKEKTVTKLGPGYRYNLYWSPDSKFVVYVDNTMTFYVTNVKTGVSSKIDQDVDLFEGGLRGFSVSWSSDSKWIAYVKGGKNGNKSVYIYDRNSKKSHRVTSGFYSDGQPTFDPDGKYLFLTTNRDLSPIYSDFDNTWIYPNSTQLAAITLRKDVPSVTAPKNDTVEMDEEESSDSEAKDGENKSLFKGKKKGGLFGKKKDKESENEEEDKDKVEPVKIDFDGMERRLEVLTSLGNVGDIAASSGKILYVHAPNSGSGDNGAELKYYDIEEQESKTIISEVWDFELSAKGDKLIVVKNGSFSIIDVAADQSAEDKIATRDMVAKINPREEWRQIFNDVWRFERDFFYDKDMHGVDWDGMKERYAPLVEQAMSRWDLNYIIGELIGELNASHTYRGGGDSDFASRKNVGYLGVDWEEDNGNFKIKHIVRGADWDNDVRSPLDMPGVDVSEGDYVLAVNGVPMSEYNDPWIAMAGMAGKTVELTVNSTANMTGSKTVLVKPMRSETRLRNLEWIESNRKKVDEMSDGKIGYIYVPSTGFDGQYELTKMFYGQWQKEGLIIDERWNNGGQIPDRFIELLNRKPLAYFAVRDGKDWQWPPVAHFGPKAMLINGWSGSGGDAFPDYFRKSELGPLIGTRTWGGIIGISGAPNLIDGGSVTVPTFRMYGPEGKWFAEGHGVEPDIEIKEDHTALAKGQDTQLETAIKNVMEQLSKWGDIHPKTPAKEIR